MHKAAEQEKGPLMGYEETLVQIGQKCNQLKLKYF